MTVSFAGRLLSLLVAAGSLAALPPPAAAVGPDGETAREPFVSPAGPAKPEPCPRGRVRGPAVAADLLVVRPVMLVGLAGGVALFVASLPFTAPTLTTDDAAHALFDQTLSALARPLGEF